MVDVGFGAAAGVLLNLRWFTARVPTGCGYFEEVLFLLEIAPITLK